jgi:hypothetical protein
MYEKRQDGIHITYHNAFGRRIAVRVHAGRVAAPATAPSSGETLSRSPSNSRR